MTAATSLHQSRLVSDLKRNPFRITFEDPALEAAWAEARLAVFQRVNQRAALVFLVMSVAFLVVDLLLVSSSPKILLTRGATALFGIGTYYALGWIRNIRLGDWLVFLTLATVPQLIWYQVFLELPIELVRDYWMAGSALLTVGVFVLFEMPIAARIVLGFAGLLHSRPPVRCFHCPCRTSSWPNCTWFLSQ